MIGKTILILGGGIGGIVLANELRRKIERKHRIVLVDKNPQHIFNPSLPWLMAGWRRSEDITKELRRMVPSSVEVIQGNVVGVDLKGQKVWTDAQQLSYDYLVVALGAELAPEAISGYDTAAYNFYTLEGTSALTNALKIFPGGRVAVVVTSIPYKCPAAPYEAALLLRDIFNRKGLTAKTELQVYTPEGQPMPVAGPVMGDAVKAMLKEQDIGYHPKVSLESIDPDRNELRFQDGTIAAYDLLVAVPPHRPPQALEKSGLGDETGWVPVNPLTLETKHENVYAIGDVTKITLSNGKPLPKAGVFAHAEAKVVAQNIVASILKTESNTEFNGLGSCWIEMGNGKAALANGNFYAKPEPFVELRHPRRLWHWGRGLFESYWMGDGLSRMASRLLLTLGRKLLRVAVSL
jgi:sulfide:quinone oxidoreductase